MFALAVKKHGKFIIVKENEDVEYLRNFASKLWRIYGKASRIYELKIITD